MSEPGRAYRLDSVSFSYPQAAQPAVRQLTLDLPEATFSAVIGPNGAGKSTLVRLLGGIARPAAGSVRLDDKRLEDWDRPALARRVAVVGQDAPPDGIRVSLEAYVEMGRTPHVRSWAPLAPRDEEAVAGALRWAQLSRLAARPLSELSGGERQRAKLARAFAQEPGILILDEPSVHLDFRHALWVFEALRSRVRSEGLTVICITHDLQLASRYADHLLLLSEGRLVAAGSPGQVLDSPALPETYGCDVRIEALGELGHAVVPVRTRPQSGPPDVTL